MAYPASEVPTHGSFRVHGFGDGDILRQAIHIAESLLEPLRIPVQGPSGRESPTPYFWKATLALISTDGTPEIERTFPDLEDRDPILLGIASSSKPSTDAFGTQSADLWIVPVENRDFIANTIKEWDAQGAGAVVAIHPSGSCAWSSRNTAFGQSHGFLERELSGESNGLCGSFIGGISFALIEELLGDNLFNKTSVRVERECLEMRPLHLGRAVEAGLATAAVVSENGETILDKRGELLGKLRQRLRDWRGPEPEAWGAHGR